MRKIIKEIIVCSLLFMTLGCQNQSKNIVINNDDGEIVNLKFYGNKKEAINVIAIEEILQDYMNQNPHVRITYESVKGVEYFEVLKKRLKSGNYDDIFMIDEDNLQKLKGEGYFEDLSKLSTIPHFSQKVLDQMKEADGKIYYVPSSISAFGLYCHLDMLKEHKQKVPKNEKELMEVCQYFVDQGITPIIANNDISLKTIAIAKALYPVYQADHSGELIAQMNKDPEILANYMKTGYEYVDKMIKNKYIDAAQTLKTEKTKDDLAQFLKGENPFMLTGAWASVRVQAAKPDFQFEVNPYPILDEGAMLVTNIDTRVCVNAKGKHVEEAKKFIEYMTQDDVMWKFVNSQCSFSPLKETRAADDKTIQPLSPYLNDHDSMLGTDSRLKYPIWTLTRQGIQKLLKGEDIESALKVIRDSK